MDDNFSNEVILQKIADIYTDGNISELSKKCGYSRPQAFYDLMNGKTKQISSKMIEKITSSFPKVNKDFLLTGKEPVLMDGISTDKKVYSDVIPKHYPTHLAVKVVTSKARAGFSEAYYADEYLEDMPTVLIEADKEYKGKYLAFEVDGDSMEPEYQKGDIVICREVPRVNWQYKLHFHDWDFVIAHGTQGIMLKEITAHNVETGEITCHSLNSDMHPDFTLNLKEVAYLFNVVEHRRSGRKYRRRN